MLPIILFPNYRECHGGMAPCILSYMFLGMHYYAMQVLGAQVALGQSLQLGGIGGANGIHTLVH